MTMDRQGRTYRHATEEDWAGVDLDQCVVYQDGDDAPINSPEGWDEAGWDAGRDGPKTLERARQVLADRIADPTAPDGPEVAGAYDHLEG